MFMTEWTSGASWFIECKQWGKSSQGNIGPRTRVGHWLDISIIESSASLLRLCDVMNSFELRLRIASGPCGGSGNLQVDVATVQSFKDDLSDREYGDTQMADGKRKTKISTSWNHRSSSTSTFSIYLQKDHQTPKFRWPDNRNSSYGLKACHRQWNLHSLNIWPGPLYRLSMCVGEGNPSPGRSHTSALGEFFFLAKYKVIEKTRSESRDLLTRHIEQNWVRPHSCHSGHHT